MNEAFKLLTIFKELLKSTTKALFKKDLSSRVYLTDVYLQSIYRQNKIPQVCIESTTSSQFKLLSSSLSDDFKLRTERENLMSLKDISVLVTLAQIYAKKHVFEFGLYRGKSLKALMANLPSEVRFTSLDITHDQLSPKMAKELKSSPRVELLCQDSLSFDETPYIHECDFIFIDADHSYSAVKSDSEKAFKMITSGGIIVWDDYNPNFQGVYRYINELYSQGRAVKNVSGTPLVYYQEK